jgi:hypothetical protein
MMQFDIEGVLTDVNCNGIFPFTVGDKFNGTMQYWYDANCPNEITNDPNYGAYRVTKTSPVYFVTVNNNTISSNIVHYSIYKNPASEYRFEAYNMQMVSPFANTHLEDFTLRFYDHSKTAFNDNSFPPKFVPTNFDSATMFFGIMTSLNEQYHVLGSITRITISYPCHSVAEPVNLTAECRE